VLREPSVDAIVGLHIWNDLPVGQVDIQPGPIFASADEFRIIVKGQMGHGALPHQAIDSVVIAAQVVTALQSLVSREIPPHEAAVLTIGTIRGGTAFNIIAPSVELSGTIRAFEPSVRRFLLERAEEVVAGVCAAQRASYEFLSAVGCPACVNNPAIAALVHQAARLVVGEENVLAIRPTTGSDDMAFFLNEVPGCFFRLGASNAELGLVQPHHTPRFDFDERALTIGAQILLETIALYLP
jgi:amidohydrolase